MKNNDKNRIDSHKLMFHPKRVASWLNGEQIYPVYMEISPTGACNHRCTFCALDYREYQPHFLPTRILKERLSELGRLGVKSIMYGGEGEPLLHRDLDEMVLHTKACGIDVALTTNAVLLTPERAGKIIPHTSWIKASINAGTPETYSAVHRTKADDFNRALENLAAAADLSKKSVGGCVIGAQIILLPENADEVEKLAVLVRDAGLSYLVVKPYSQHLMSKTDCYRDIDYSPYLELQNRLKQYERDDFTVIFRMNTIKKMHRSQRGYEHCQALPFWSYIDAEGFVWGCSAYLGDERFRFGSILEDSFEKIWNGECRKRSMDFVSKELDTEGCRMNCRMDEINLYLWELTHPSEHVNFI
ncbi:MAG: radical SAM protein [Desulfuromonadaceae bacterium]|nr:radical SAM protein [Desulfuromonadaceae bacterium]MDD2854323.1 radical SAM protein [Desulfuromonadaceae bacterium]